MIESVRLYWGYPGRIPSIGGTFHSGLLSCIRFCIRFLSVLSLYPAKVRKNLNWTKKKPSFLPEFPQNMESVDNLCQGLVRITLGIVIIRIEVVCVIHWPWRFHSYAVKDSHGFFIPSATWIPIKSSSAITSGTFCPDRRSGKESIPLQHTAAGAGSHASIHYPQTPERGRWPWHCRLWRAHGLQRRESPR